MHVLAIILIFDQELTKSTDINHKDVSVFHPLFRFYTSIELTTKLSIGLKQRGYYHLHIYLMILPH